MNTIQKNSLIFFVLLWFQISVAQEKPVVKDTLAVKKQIEKISKRNKFYKFIYKIAFEPIKSNSKKVKPKVVRKKKITTYEGKIIRNINIETLDPFGFSESDSSSAPKRFLSKTGNRLHIKTKTITVRNLLLFKKNKPLDTILIKESERLLRKQRFIRKVEIVPKLISKKSDSVDVYIRVLDSWSIIPQIQVSSSKFDFDLTDRNFLGTGHQFENIYKKRFADGKTAYSGIYYIPNIANTYINTTLDYRYDLENNYSKVFNIERPFYSPLAIWAGGIYFDQKFKALEIADAENVFAFQNFKSNSQDFWIGKATPILKGTTENSRTTNLIKAARYYNIKYTESPTIEYDSLNVVSNESLYLFGIGISSRQFIQDKYLFNYQITEDVPIGRAFGITAGLQDKNNNKRLYLGAKISFGNYYKLGYLSTNFEYGTYFKGKTSEQNAFSAQVNYFTNLMQGGDWKFRQFAKAQFIIGNRRLDSNFDKLTINESNGISGFNTKNLFGTKKILFTFQSQSYSPYSLWGFRLNPYLNYTIGLLGDAANGFNKSKAYSQFGVGMIIRNDYLVFSSFQLSLAFYPQIPENGDNIFLTNAIHTEDFGFQDFELAKPETIKYK